MRNRNAYASLVALASALVLVLASASAALAGVLVRNVRNDRAVHAPGATVTTEVELRNDTGAPFSGDVTVSYTHLGETVAADQTQAVTLAPGASSTLSFVWLPPIEDFRGYLLPVPVRGPGAVVVDTGATAVDVSSDWSKFPRYGFVSRFDAGLDAAGTMRWLADHHVNAVQFYDWQWKHHVPYSPAASWPDIANRTISRATVTSLIDEAHARGMLAMSYNLIAGAYDGYWSDGSGVQTLWGAFRKKGVPPDLADQDSHPLPSSWATQKIFQFDPSNPDWQAYICARQQEVIDNFPFDGWHADSLGNRGRLYDAQGNTIILGEKFAPFLNAMISCLTPSRLVFNTVGTYGQDAVARDAGVDIIYSEIWDDSKTKNFYDLTKIVDSIRKHTQKGIVFPGYMNYEYAKKTPDGTTRPFIEASVRLADAAIFALGASHLELGDQGGMLSSEYFPNQKLVMDDSLRTAVRSLYDFHVAYENLLRDGAVPVKNRVDTPKIRSNTRGAPRGIWKIVTAKPGKLIVSLINLTGTKVKLWRDVHGMQTTPPLMQNVPLKVYHGLSGVPTVKVASPDFDHGAATVLPAVAGADGRGAYVTFTVPQLLYWDLVWVEEP